MQMQMSRKGATGTQVSALIGSIILIALIVSLAPNLFGQLVNITAGGAPAWVATTLTVIIAAGVVLMVWKGFGHR